LGDRFRENKNLKRETLGKNGKGIDLHFVACTASGGPLFKRLKSGAKSRSLKCREGLHSAKYFCGNNEENSLNHLEAT
jgi:hypothetical protein